MGLAPSPANLKVRDARAGLPALWHAILGKPGHGEVLLAEMSGCGEQCACEGRIAGQV
jgi:hypothetical protein